MILTVTLNPVIDKTVTIPGFKIGEDFREKAIYISAGGKGVNSSQVFKRLGVGTIASGFLGGPDGEWIRQELDAGRIRHDFCLIKGNSRTSLTVIDPARNTITRVLERGPRVSGKDLNTFKKKYTSLLKRCQYVTLSGRNIPGAGNSFYADLIEIAKRKKVKVIFDTSGKPYSLGIRKKPFMIKPNLKEAEQVLGRKLFLTSHIKKAACDLRDRGIHIVAISMGSRGAIVCDGNEVIKGVPPKIKRRSPVGCGDAFIAGFIASYSRGKYFGECVRMAVACGAANALSFNPGSIKPGAIKQLYKQVKIIAL